MYLPFISLASPTHLPYISHTSQDLRRIYNVPHPSHVASLIPPTELAKPENAAYASHCAAGLARVGVMTIAPYAR